MYFIETLLMGVYVLTGKKKQGEKVQYFDYSLLAIIIFLVCFGLIMLYSTSSYSAQIKFGDSMYYFKRQAIISAGSFVIMLGIAKFNYHIYGHLAKPAYFVAMFMMALVQTPLGLEFNHARRWLKMPFGFTLQPSEIMKIAIVLYIPLLICKAGKKIRDWKVVGTIFAWGLVAALGVWILTDNLSTGVIVGGMMCIIIFVSHPKTAPFLMIAGAGAGLVAIGIKILSMIVQDAGDASSFRLRRILVWLEPEKYLSEGGYQVMQGLYAIGSGGFFGKGLGNSAQKMIIPEAQNDMILSIICEELGVFGALILLGMFGILLYRLMFIAQNAPDLYGSLLVTGIFAHIALQVLFNVMVVLNVIPTTGITLPFISYGGTSVVFLLAEMGLALSVSNRIRFEE